MRTPQAHIEPATASTVTTDEGPFFSTREGEQDSETQERGSDEHQRETTESGTESEPLEITVADDDFIRDLEERSRQFSEEEETEPAPPAEGVRRGSRVPDDLQALRDQQASGQEPPAIAAIETGRLSEMAESFGSRTPVEMGLSAGEFNTALRTADQNEIDSINEELPDLDQPTGLEPGEGRIRIDPPEPQEFQPESVEGQDQGQVSTPIEPTPQPAPARARTSIRNPRDESELERAMASLDVDTQVDTSLGPRPEINLSGRADPEQIDRQESENTRSLLFTQNEEINGFRRDFGENDIYPNIPTETLETRDVRNTGELPSMEVEGQFPVMLESDVELVNEDILTELGEERDRALEESQSATEEFDNSRSTQIEESLDEVRREERLASEEQIQVRESNAESIQGMREEHEQETQTILDDYNAEAETERQTHDSDLEAEIDTVGSNVESFFDEAEGEASEQQQEAEADVARRRREAEEAERNRSWLDAAVDAVTDFFNDLIEAVTSIIDDLRASIKALFDAVKARVAQLIDAARNLVIGMIRAFGNLLIRISNIALARFPGLRDRVNARIRGAMDRAEQLVNEIADRLKETVMAILDRLASAIDGMLAAFKEVLIAALEFLKEFTLAVVRMAHAFYEYILRSILQLATLVAFCALMMTANIFLSTAWHFLGRSTKERLVDLFLSTMIWLFENAPDEFDQGFLWPIFVNMQLGYFREIYGWEMEAKIAFYEKIANLMLSPSFWGNFILGIFVGIWDNIWGILEGIWMLIRFIFYDLWVLIDRLIDMLADIAPDVMALIRGLNEDIHAFINEIRTTGKEQLDRLRKNLSRENIEQFFEGLGNDLRVRAMLLGGRLANQAREFMMRDDAYATIGMALGRATGYILVEVLLAIFTAGIGTAIKWGLKGVKVAVRFARLLGSVGRAGGFFSRVIGFFNRGVKWLIRAIIKFAEKVASVARGILQRFKTIFQNLSRRIDDIVARLTGRRPRTPDAPDGAPRPRQGDGPDGQRPRDRDDNDALENQRRWVAFETAVAQDFRRFRDDGIPRAQALSILSENVRRHSRIARAPLIDRDHGWFQLKAIRRGLNPIPRNVSRRVPVDSISRWGFAREAIIERTENLPQSQINQPGLTTVLAPFIRRYKFDQLYPRWDPNESDWDIMGAMSPTRKLHEVKDPEEIFEIFESRVNRRIGVLRNNRRLKNGYAREEVEDEIRSVMNRNGGRDWLKYMEIFRTRRSVQLENLGDNQYQIRATLYRTSNRSRIIGSPIEKLPNGATRNTAIDMVWFNARYSQIRHLRVRPSFAGNPRFWDSVYYPTPGIFSAHPDVPTTLRVPKSQSTNPNANRAVTGRLTARIGINPINKMDVGDVVRRTPSSPRRGSAVRSFRTLIFHYNRDLANLGYQVDHVRDLGYGGHDRFDNLWPLTANKNQRTSNRMVGQRVHFQMNRQRVIGSPNPPRMFSKWFIIRRVQTI